MIRTMPLLLAIAVFCVISGVRCANWACVHDEGVTFDQAIGRISPEVRHRAVPQQSAIEPHGVTDVPRVMAARGMHPPAYYVLLNLWVKVCGRSPSALLAYGIALGVLSIIGAWLLAGALTRTHAAQVIAVALLAVSPAHHQYVTFIRPYASLIGVALFATWALVRYFDAADRRQAFRWLIAFSLITTLGLYWVYHYLFVAAWHFAALGVAAITHPKESRHRDLLMAFAGGMIVTAGLAPWLSALRWQSELQRSGYFTGTPTISEALRSYGVHLERFVFNSAPGEWFIMGLRWLLLATTAVLLCQMLATWRRDRRLVLLLLLPLWPIAIYAADVLNDSHTITGARYCSAMIGVLLLGIACACGLSRWHRVGIIVGACWIVMLADLSVSQARRENNTDTRIAAQRIADHAARQDNTVIVISTIARGSAWPLILELDRRGVRNVAIRCTDQPSDLSDAIFIELDRDDANTKWPDEQLVLLNGLLIRGVKSNY